jgi:hypothetical protein
MINIVKWLIRFSAILVALSVVLFILFFIIPNIGDRHFQDTMPQLPASDIDYGMKYYGNNSVDRNFTYDPHYVTFHIHPEKEGIPVAAWASDFFPPTTGYTDNRSDITFPLYQFANYNILVGDYPKRCSFNVFPTQTEYTLECP